MATTYQDSQKKLDTVCIVGNSLYERASKISKNVVVIEEKTKKEYYKRKTKQCKFVLFNADLYYRSLAPQIAAELNCGLCADCTKLQTDGKQLFMYRPALSGDVIAKIECQSSVTMATVRESEKQSDKVVFGIGVGAAKHLGLIKALAKKYNAKVCASRKAVDMGLCEYACQVGLTGKVISPKVYVAFGISGEVHHIVGIERANTVIAINNDKNAKMFDNADIGIVIDIKNFISLRSVKMSEELTGYYRFSYNKLKKFCIDAFIKFGFTENESGIISDVLLLSDLYGIESHGMQRLVRYHKGIEKGLIKPQSKPEIIFETPVSAVIDGKDGMGQLIGHFAMNTAIEKAMKSGIAIVSARNSNHYGIAGYYAKMACDKGLIGISMTNSEAIMVPTFGKKAMLGSNPIAFSMPAQPYPFLFDSSTTVVTRGKLEIYKKLGKEIPEGWAIDSTGNVSIDSFRVLKDIVSKAGGGILPIGGDSEQTGGHKGYGYGMVCEIFSSILSLGLTSNNTHTDGKGGTCHGFIAINPEIFGDAEKIKEHLSNFLAELRQSPKAESQTRIYTHGEKER